jgi:hypothetical protein
VIPRRTKLKKKKMSNYIVTSLIDGIKYEHICTKEVDKCNNVKYFTDYGTVDEKYIVNVKLKDKDDSTRL